MTTPIFLWNQKVREPIKYSYKIRMSIVLDKNSINHTDEILGIKIFIE